MGPVAGDAGLAAEVVAGALVGGHVHPLGLLGRQVPVPDAALGGVAPRHGVEAGVDVDLHHQHLGLGPALEHVHPGGGVGGQVPDVEVVLALRGRGEVGRGAEEGHPLAVVAHRDRLGEAVARGAGRGAGHEGGVAAQEILDPHLVRGVCGDAERREPAVGREPWAGCAVGELAAGAVGGQADGDGHGVGHRRCRGPDPEGEEGAGGGEGQAGGSGAEGCGRLHAPTLRRGHPDSIEHGLLNSRPRALLRPVAQVESGRIRSNRAKSGRLGSTRSRSGPGTAGW